ncbi:hypothetical protein [Nocardioides sp. InS609-2]|uniref:hypothetical protein n=1 Tax=Nocardioides sp. InS609-2 TaxID=2760705 RepID=UPI0020BE99EB|nr:hypothetical protein [Nocardioides sp. InS609-2]
MFGVGTIELLVLGLLPVVFVMVMLVVLLAFARRDVKTGREWLAVVAIRIVGGAAGVAAAGATVFRPMAGVDLGLGRGLLLAPAIVGLGVMLGVAVGETVVRPRRAAGLRTASLEPRRVWAYLPRPLSWTVALLGGLLVATLALTTVTASADDMGRAGRSLGCQTGSFSTSHGPYPGSFYSLPLLAILALVAVVGLLAARVVVRRPRGFAPSEYGDGALRMRSLTVIVAAAGLAIAATHAGVALTAGGALNQIGGSECGAGWMAPVGLSLLVSLPIAVVVTCWCGLRLLLTDRLGAPDRVAVR